MLASDKGDKEADKSDETDVKRTEVDARVQGELEKLNCSSDVINKLEKDLELKRRKLRELEQNRERELGRLRAKLGNACIERAAIYYEAARREQRRSKELEVAKENFEKAESRLSAAQEMVSVAEQGFRAQSCDFDETWQETINHALEKVSEADGEKRRCWLMLAKSEAQHTRISRRLREISSALERSIRRSKPYFQTEKRFDVLLDDQRREVELVEIAVKDTKKGYSQSLRALESISEEIHRERRDEAKDEEESESESELPSYELLEAADLESDSDSSISLEVVEVARISS